MSKSKFHIGCVWSAFGKAHKTDFNCALVQYRRCVICNKIEANVINCNRYINADDANNAPQQPPRNDEGDEG